MIRIIRSDNRHHSDFGWLSTYWHFCFSEYHDPANLAWSNLNRTTPDLAAAEGYARSALLLVPYWHYVRDILLPQILAAKASAAAGPR